ncbi:MAG: hypothetical protein ACRD2Y_15890, partial [Terriglobales bacterium]
DHTAAGALELALHQLPALVAPRVGELRHALSFQFPVSSFEFEIHGQRLNLVPLIPDLRR